MDDRFGVNSSYLAGENQYQHAHRKGKEGGRMKESWYGFRKACVDGRTDARLGLFYRPISMIRWWLVLRPKVKPYFFRVDLLINPYF